MNLAAWVARQRAALDRWSSPFATGRPLWVRLSIPAAVALVVLATLGFIAVSEGAWAAAPFVVVAISGFIAHTYGREQRQRRAAQPQARHGR